MDVELWPDSNFQYGIEGVTFRFYAAEEVRALSVKEITNPETFDTLSQPTIGGLYDPALGPSESYDACSTCGQGMVHCPGHLGHIELPLTNFNPVFFDIMYKMLKSTCFNCHRVMVHPLPAHVFISQCCLLDKGHCTAVVKLEEICGDTSEASTKEETESQKREIIAKFTEEALKELNSSVVQVKNVEAVRQEVTARFMSTHLIKNGKCPHCKAAVKKLRQEHKSKIIMVGKIADNKKTSKYSKVEKMNLDPIEDSDNDDDDSDDDGEPAAKRRKLKEFQKKSNNVTKKKGAVSTEVTLLTALKIKEHLHKVWESDGLLLKRLFPAMASSTSSTPVDVFFMEVIAVPPSRFRPIAKLGDRKFENAQTLNFSKILKTCVALREVLLEIEKRSDGKVSEMEPLPQVVSLISGKTLLDKLNTALVQLQSNINYLFDSDLDKLSREVNPGIRQLLEKKQGLFRKNMMGKRVNYAARSVISPDPNIDTNEIGIPMVFAKVLTYPQRVTPWNVMELKQAVINGPNVYPGAFCIINEDGSKVMIDSRNLQQREALAKQLLTPSIKRGHHMHSTSKTVFRHLKNGDVLLLNRQPTLHRPSIQGHKARVLKGEKTLRLHYSNCKAYNADFDGDEMNAHLPQNELARSESYNLALTDFQYLVPKDGTPLAGLIQDHMVSGVALTIRGRFFNKADYCRLVYTAVIDKPGPICLLPPSILKPYRLWSGKQVLSTVVLNVIPQGRPPLCMTGKAKVPEKSWIKVSKSNLCPPQLDHLGESDVVIRQGELLVGILDKGHYGPTPYGLIHSCYELYGGATAGKLLGCFGRLFMNFLQWKGFTLGVHDILVTKQADDIRTEIIQKSPGAGVTAVKAALELDDTVDQTQILAALKKAHFNKDERPMIELDMSMRTQTNDIQNNVVNACMPSGLVKLFPDNNLQLMVVSGAKGSSVNCMQISCLLGQIELEGKRPPLMLSGKTLPSFVSYDITPRAGGFVTGRFLTGIRQQEYFFHCMAGREGLVDTAVKTSRSGYLQRCIIKHLEGIKVNYDLTVRDSDSSVIQFYYGEDSLDILKTAYLSENQYSFLAENHSVIQADPYPRDTNAKKIKKVEKKITKWQQKHHADGNTDKVRTSGYLKFFRQVGEDVVSRQPIDPKYQNIKGRSHRDLTLCQMWSELDEKQRNKYKKKYSGCPDPVQSQFSPYILEALPERLSSIVSGYAKKQSKSRTSSLSEGEFLDLLRLKVKRSMVEPGESVGLLCSQSIGEPSTQMTLNTFHFAGRGEMNVTLGIPRLREVLMVGSKTIKTPAMDIPIRPGEGNKDRAKHLQKQFTKVHLDKVLKDVQVDEWLSIKHKVSTQRKRVFQITFNFLPRLAYKERYSVKPQQILNYMEKVYFKHLVFVIRKKINVMAKTRLLSHGTQKRTSAAEKQSEETMGTSYADDDDDSDVDDANDGDAVSKKEHSRHDQEHEYDDSDNESNDDGNDVMPDDEVEMDGEDGDEMEEVEYGDLEENLIRKKEKDHKSGRINAVLQLAPEVETYDFDAKKKLWCTITLSFPLQDSKFDVLSVVEADVRKCVVHQIPGLAGCYLGEQKGPNGPELHLKTEGINIQEMAKHEDLLDLNRLYCNDIHAVADTFGIEAASKVIVKEIQNVFAAYGIHVDYRHLSLLADYMTFEGRYKPFNRAALTTNPSPIQKMTFETTMKFLTNASIQSQVDELRSPSAQIVLGKTVNCGTGCLELYNPLVRV